MEEQYPGVVDFTVKTFYLEEKSAEQMADDILREKPDIVAFSVYTWNYREAMECSRIIKRKNKDIAIFCGGPQVSPIAAEIMAEHPYIDVVPYISAPGEIIFYHLVMSLYEGKSLGLVEGIIYRDATGALIKTKSLSEDLDYDTAPSPYLSEPFHIDPSQAYLVSLESFRGCVMDCGYCIWGQGLKKIHYFPLERIFKEIEVVYHVPGIRHVNIAVSDMFLDKKRAIAIIEHILKQNSNVITEFDTNVSRLDQDSVKLIAQLPEHRFCFALQSANPDTMDAIGKLRPRLDIFVKKIRAFKEWLPDSDFSIDVMLGLPQDNLDGFKTTLDVCLLLQPTRVALNYPVYLLPGTKFFEQRDSLGLKYSDEMPYAVIETASFPKKDMEEAIRLAIWMDILTYYYMGIADFFYRVCAGGKPGTWISRLQIWIKAIEKDIDIFGSCKNIVDIATGKSIQDWNRLKGSILRSAAKTENAYKIYQAIYELENKAHLKDMGDTILPGMAVFEYMLKNKIDSIEFSQFNLLPAKLTEGFPEAQVRGLFSRYKL